VTDPTGAVVANAKVTVADNEKGVKRGTSTDSRGEFVITGLSPATYEVRTEKAGFESEVHKGIVVNVGQTVTVDFGLKLTTAKEVVEVTTEPPVVDAQRGSQADVINQELIQDLPIDRRDYLTFALLDPAINDARNINGADLRVRQTPQSGLSVYGSNGRGNNVTVDGGEFNGDSGSVLVNLGQDAVQEFQINRTNYTAELGAGSGASVNIVSKSGSNNFHGSVYAFFRNDVFDAANPFAGTNALQPGQLSGATGFSFTALSQPVKNSLSRQQFGGTLGFPIKKDKTFLFLSAEGLHERKQTAVPLLTNSNIFAPNAGQQTIISQLTGLGATPVPCLTGQPALPAAACGGILRNILTINPASSPLSHFLVNMFETNGGLFQAPVTNAYFSGRLDHTFNDHDQMYVRYLYARNNDGNPDVSGLLGISGGSQIRTWTSSFLASWFHQFSAKTQNEARVQWNLVQFNDFANDPGGPSFTLSGFGAFGRDTTLPDFSTLRQYEFADNLTAIRGRHSMKMGFYEDLRGNRTASATFLGDSFSFGNLPGGILSPCLQVPAACGLTAPFTTLNSLQSFSLGLPLFFQGGFGNPTTVSDLPLTAVYWQDSWQMVPSFTLNYGLRYELDTRWVTPTDNLNFAPRVSFAWDPFKDHKTVIRGGAGIFYSPTYIQIDYSTKELGFVNGAPPQITNFLVPITGALGSPAINSATIFQTLFAQGKLGGCGLNGGPSGAGVGGCITAADLAPFGNLSGFSAFFSQPKTFHNPYSEQLSFGVEHQLGSDMSVAASYIYVHTLRLPRTVDTNMLPTAPKVINPFFPGSMPFQTWSSQFAPQCALLLNNPCFANPLVLENNVYESNASALYQGGTLEFKKRFTRHYTLMANYTYSKAIDDNTDFNLSYVAANETNFAAERGLSSFDERHKITVTGILDSPWKNRVLADFQLAPIIRYDSGQPFNVLAGFDLNGDTHSNDRPLGVGRNSGTPVSYFDVDTRLSRQFRLRERTTLQFMAEAFNLFNRTNYSSLNNSCGTQACAFTPPAHFSGSNQGLLGTSQPFAFNAVAGNQKRVFQFGARVSF
jgi:hypothetical protein